MKEQTERIIHEVTKCYLREKKKELGKTDLC